MITHRRMSLGFTKRKCILSNLFFLLVHLVSFVRWPCFVRQALCCLCVYGVRLAFHHNHIMRFDRVTIRDWWYFEIEVACSQIDNSQQSSLSVFLHASPFRALGWYLRKYWRVSYNGSDRFVRMVHDQSWVVIS